MGRFIEDDQEERPMSRRHSFGTMDLSRIRRPLESREWSEWVSNKTGEPMAPPDWAKDRTRTPRPRKRG
jgi:hypothetical protein